VKIRTTRVEAFSDGVIAIVITIMVLEFKLPDFKDDDSSWRINRYLLNNLPYFVAYIFSFLMIGVLWVNHHHMFHLLERLDEKMIWKNLFFLFWLSLIPITTAIIGASPQVAESVALYGFVMLMVTLAYTLMRSYSIKHNLVHHEGERKLDQQIKKTTYRGKRKSIIALISYLLSVPLAFVNIYFAYACFLLSPIVFFIPEGVDDEKLAEKIIEKNQ
jgi:uncharacterized membrane protein